MGVQFLIHEGGLHQRLTVVERAVHLDGGDVPSQGGELLLLYLADLSLGVEHIDVNAFHAEEAVGHGTARVARSGYQYIYLLLAFLADEVAQQPGHEAGAHVLEGERRSVEEFERPDVFAHGHQRRIKLKGVIYDVLQRVGGNVLAEEGVGHTVGYLLETEPVHVRVEALRQRFDAVGHVEAFVGGQSFYHGVFQADAAFLLVRTIVSHTFSIFINSFINSSSFINP